jgi:ribosomal protein S18 acetylase RimI-like enzyme
MRLTFSLADPTDAPALAALHTAASEELTRRFGQGVWSSVATERGVLLHMRHAKILIARRGKSIVGMLNLQTKKPWAIDISYFTTVKKAIYLTGMAVLPSAQGKGIGKALLEEAAKHVRIWPADAIRLDAWDADAGAGAFYIKCGFRETGRVIYRKAPLIYLERVLLPEEAKL